MYREKHSDHKIEINMCYSITDFACSTACKKKKKKKSYRSQETIAKSRICFR